mmetsp:Transcript_35218/g.75220  ORF Transcript_35218/g.75220 Transcript_35218/m.75220 type:complete len:111 (-) Transcript_35218:439-771(-)
MTLSNKNISLQVVNNRSGNIFLSASTMERAIRERLHGEQRSTSDSHAAAEAARKLAARAQEKGTTAITWERGSLRYGGKVKVIVDTLREHGIRFVRDAAAAPQSSPPVSS